MLELFYFFLKKKRFLLVLLVVVVLLNEPIKERIISFLDYSLLISQ